MADYTPAFDAAIVFVHGIGAQEERATLDAWATPLRAYLASIVDENIAGGAPDGPMAPNVLTEVRVERSGDERPPPTGHDHSRHEQSGLPAHEVWELTSQGADTSTERWLVAEAWWARSFALPSMHATRRWALRVWPRVVINHWWASLQFTVGRASATELSTRHPIQSLRSLVHRYLVGWLILTALFVRATISWFGFWEVAGNELMTDIVGDTLVAVESGGRDILSRVELQLAWCLASVKPDAPVVVVAHSQGALLAHQVISELDPKLAGRVRLITVGAGIVPIHGLRDVGGWPKAAGCWLALVALSLWAFFLYVVAGLVFTGRGVSLWSPVVFVVLPLLALVGARVGGTRDILGSIPALRLGDKVASWVDVSSWWDPVCTGPLLAGLGVVDDFAVGANGYNLFAEHGAYRQNDLVMLTIAEVMAKSRGITLSSDQLRRERNERALASNNRRLRVLRLEVIGLYVLVLAFVIFTLFSPKMIYLLFALVVVSAIAWWRHTQAPAVRSAD